MPITKTSAAIFGEWQHNQSLFTPPIMSSLSIDTSDYAQERFKKQYDSLQKRYAACPASKKQIDAFFAIKKKFPPHHIIKMMEYVSAEDISSLMAYLKDNNFASSVLNKEEENLPIYKVMRKYDGMMRLLFSAYKRDEQNKLLYALADNFFTFCFGEDTYEQCAKILSRQTSHSLGRLLYSLMWTHLAGKGWITWHTNTLNNLVKQARQGNEIVYIAGGNDIYQLLKQGIYSIRVIDPFLPTQSIYYSEGWRFLVQSKKGEGIGDRVECLFDDKKITLQRAKHQEHGTFRAMLSSGRHRTLPQSTTTWHVYEDGHNKPSGSVVLERRFTHQNDFKYHKNRSLLISFNELYFITTPGELSWGIDVRKFDPKLTIHIKQLKQPISQRMAQNIHDIDASDDFDFIQLGNCID